MKLATQTNEAVMGNVQGVGEFRIRNSAKAFNILSSGLYANKIRAIIRELSCNAVDSHVAAEVEKYRGKCREASKKYPLLAAIGRSNNVNADAIAQYVNLIDKE